MPADRALDFPDRFRAAHGRSPLIAVTDVQYADDGTAAAALAIYAEPSCQSPIWQGVAPVPRTEPYEPGALYKRELPCIRAALALAAPPDLLIVDGYATLDPAAAPASAPGQPRRWGYP